MLAASRCVKACRTSLDATESQTRSHYVSHLTPALAFERLLAADVDLDLLRLRFGLLGQLNLQHALVIVGLELSRSPPWWAA